MARRIPIKFGSITDTLVVPEDATQEEIDQIASDRLTELETADPASTDIGPGGDVQGGGQSITGKDIEEFAKGLPKGFGEASRQVTAPLLGLGSFAIGKAAEGLSKLDVAQGGKGFDVPKETLKESMGSFQTAEDKPKFSSGVQKAGGALGEFATKATMGQLAGGAALPGAGGFGREIAKGAITNVPFVPKAFEEGGGKGAAIDVALNTAIDASLFGLGKAKSLLLPKLDDAIEKGIKRGVSPQFRGSKKTIQGMGEYFDDAKKAVEIISQNWDEIGKNVSREVGEEIAQPRNVMDFAVSVGEAKKDIYNRYHQLSQNAQEFGSVFDADNVVKRLKGKLTANKKLSPTARKYAENRINELAELQGEVPEVVEERIKELNRRALPAYQGGDVGVNAHIDASVAHEVKEQLDKQIMESGNPGWADLRQQYKALKSVEKDVVNSALKRARKASAGLPEYTSIFSTGDLAAGILSANPALIGKGVAQGALAQLAKVVNDPDRAVKAMFKAANKHFGREYGGKITADVAEELLGKTEKATDVARETMRDVGDFRKQLKQGSGQRATSDAIRDLRAKPKADPNVEAVKRFQSGRFGPFDFRR